MLRHNQKLVYPRSGCKKNDSLYTEAPFMGRGRKPGVLLNKPKKNNFLPPPHPLDSFNVNDLCLICWHIPSILTTLQQLSMID